MGQRERDAGIEPEYRCADCGKPTSKNSKSGRCSTCSGAGHTREQRDTHSLCNARKKNGERCRAFAGQGTDHPGIGLCRHQGGAMTPHRKHAVAIEAKRRMVTLGQPLDAITAPEALMGLLRASAGHVAWLQEEVAALDSLASHEAQVLVKLYDSERDRLARTGEACVRAGVAEAVVRLEQTKAETTLHAIRDAAADAGLNGRQMEALGVALRKCLAQYTEDPERATRSAEDADARLAQLREQISADDERRIAHAAERRARELSGLTFPPDELVPARDDAA